MGGVYELDFGLNLGKPVAVRRPKFYPVEGLAYLLPRKVNKEGNGEVVLVICLSHEDIARLRECEEWNRFAVFIG